MTDIPMMVDLQRRTLDNMNYRRVLKQQLAWVKHWQDDHRAGLLPTDQSLNDAREAIERVLDK